MRTTLLVIATSAVILTGCPSVKNEALSSSNRDRVAADVAKSSLSDDDKKAFFAASVRSPLGNYVLDGKTVAQIINEQKHWEAEQDAEEAAAHEAQLRPKLNALL